MTDATDRARSLRRAAVTLAIAAAIYEAFARSGAFPSALMPTLPAIGRRLVEMLAAVPWGLGWLIFGAREFLNTDVMLAGIAVIGMIGLALEQLVFKRLEDFTVVRWGMMAS